MKRLAAAAIGILVLPTLLVALAVVYPRTSAPGAYERYVLRVPNEKNVPTTRIELRFPRDVRVSSFADVSGWKLDVITDSAGTTRWIAIGALVVAVIGLGLAIRRPETP